MNYQSSAILDKLKRNRKNPLRTAVRPQGVLDGLGNSVTAGTATTTRQAPLYQGQPPAPDPNVIPPQENQGQPPAPDPTVIPPQENQGQGNYTGGNILDFLSGDLKDLYESNLQGMLSGDAFAPYKAASNEAFARAAQHIRARSAGGAGGMLGQGAATSAQQEAEQSILSGLATKGIEEAMAESELKNKGMGMAFNLAQAEESAQQFDETIASNEKLAEDANWLEQQGIDMEHAQLYGYEDQNGKWIKGLLELQDSSHDWDALNLAIKIGDYDAASKIWGDMFSDLDLDFSKIEGIEKTEKFNAGMAQMTKYIASGLKWEDALVAMKNDGTFENLGLEESEIKKMYETLTLSSNHVNQLLNGIDDETLKMLFPDVDPKEAKTMITKLSMFGGLTFNQDGSFSIDAEIFETLFGDGDDHTPDDPDQTQIEVEEDFDDFLSRMPADAPKDIADWYTQDQWDAMGKPKDWKGAIAWLNSAENINSYIKQMYNIDNPNLSNIKDNDRKLILTAIRAGNKELRNHYFYGDDNAGIGKMQEVAALDETYWKDWGLSTESAEKHTLHFDNNGDLNFGMLWRDWKNVIPNLETGKIFEIPLPGGGSSTVLVNSHTTRPYSTKWYAKQPQTVLRVTDVDTGVEYNIIVHAALAGLE